MRKLAAIIFTDIEGFTKLMQHNETEAMHVLERYKQTYLHQVKQFRGQHIKFLGDGTLTIFSSVIDAVNCAIALQRALQTEPIIPVRIGIHQGDIIIEKKDVIGDAVNLASRIQPYGIGGSIILSEKVCTELQNHSEISTVALGSFHLKNIFQPVNLHAVIADGIKVPYIHKLNESGQQSSLNQPVKTGSAFRTLLKKPRLLRVTLPILVIGLLSTWFVAKTTAGKTDELLKVIAVFPFESIDAGEQNTVFAKGLTEEMIALLSSNPGLTIKEIPANVASNNKDNLKKLLHEIKAGSILEGKVQHDNDKLYVFVNLQNISTGEVIWSKTYREKFEDLMSVQQQVAIKISESLNTGLGPAGTKSFASGRTNNPEAYRFYIEGRVALRKRTPRSMQEAISLFNKAIKEDSNFALAYSGLSDTYTILIDNGYLPYNSGINLARNAVNHAFKLDSSSAEIRASRAIFFSSLEGRYADAVKELRLALSIRPKYADANQWYALELAAAGQFDSAVSHIDKALLLDPYSERIWANKALILKFARQYKEAIKVLNHAIDSCIDNCQLLYRYKTECHFWLGQTDSVLSYAALNKDNLRNALFWKTVFNHDKSKLQQMLNEQLKNEHINYTEMALLCAFMEENEKALYFIKNAYNNKEFSSLIYLKVEPGFDNLHKENVFIDITNKLGL
ncbi:adenylate/guanylate cyclase domain-containing protein [Parafilimonas terrae]|uniref:Adenylate cyclase, class 3 n=1 Tax=Parafilimonas terrae TaxID=1465490 RepID=A0A1I5U1E9_9BACT|nr:adenylate/guanylate cyclase domain-containing protein [Parafilimonas terrae]SFP89118.1 Adenylate cyclase, class 3 [Parafilimonas terrae]